MRIDPWNAPGVAKHAYLIIAHHQVEVLERLLSLLDDSRNDLYVHLDRRLTSVDVARIKAVVHHAELFLLDRTSVNWGATSLIKCELRLLMAATQREYAYYHLLSGSDLPLKPQSHVHAYFERHEGLEFIEFANSEHVSLEARVSLHHIFQEYLRRPWPKPVRIGIRGLNRISLVGQQRMRVNRLRSLSAPLKFGSNWFSITDALARYVLDNVGWIRKNFYGGRCADELFLQTLVDASQFRDAVADRRLQGRPGNLREIDWRRADDNGSPYVWRSEDFATLMESDRLFARKFELNVDAHIISRIYEHVLKLQTASHNRAD